MENENTNHPQEEKKNLDEAVPGEGVEIDDSEACKVKFLNGGKGELTDPHVVVEVASEKSDISFTGLGKEELMQYATDPFWVRVRMILFVLFWVGWVAMLVAAIIIIVVAPRCPERPELKWYQTETMYQIFPKSFQDTTSEASDPGAGVGDLQGIKNRVSYLEGLGVKAFWINSIYKSGGLYDGSDVVNHKMIDPIFGDQATFDALRKTTKKKGMKIILDFIPNHTGKDHPWFTSSKAKEDKYMDYYIWADGTGPSKDREPNNWKTIYGTPAWTYNDERKQFYYHKDMAEYPELNLRNADVQNELKGILEHWLEKGVDGFNVVGAQYLMENVNLTDEVDLGEHTVDHPDNMGLIQSWRKVLDSYSDKPGRERVMVMTIDAMYDNASRVYYDAGAHIVPSKSLVNFQSSCRAQCLKEKMSSALDVGKWLGWMLDSDETERFGNTDEALHKALQTLHLLLPGTSFVYYGDEIAMKNGIVNGLDIKDPAAKAPYLRRTRDSFRTPMLWTNSKNAGFCSDDFSTWLPVNKDGLSVQENQAFKLGSGGVSMLESFTGLVTLRTRESFQWGSVQNYDAIDDDIFYFTRNSDGFPSHLIAINMAPSDGVIAHSFAHVAKTMTPVYHSEEGILDGSTTVDTESQTIGFSKRGEVYVFQY